MSKPDWFFTPFDKSFKRDSFDCGKAQLNEYLKKQISQDIRKNVSKAFVAVSTQDANLIVGYYTLSANSLHFEELPAVLHRKLPRYPIPLALIGRLAVDKKYQGLGLGKGLLVDALRRTVLVSKSFGVFGVVVDAKDVQAKEFYEYFGFIPLVDRPDKLILPLETVKPQFG
jgi:predicted N-acetyltransferase YhbS